MLFLSIYFLADKGRYVVNLFLNPIEKLSCIVKYATIKYLISVLIYASWSNFFEIGLHFVFQGPGGPMPGRQVARIVESKNKNFPKGKVCTLCSLYFVS